MESKFKVHPDVARYNSSDEDNVTQVGAKTCFLLFSHGFLGGFIWFPAEPPVGRHVALCLLLLDI